MHPDDQSLAIEWWVCEKTSFGTLWEQQEWAFPLSVVRSRFKEEQGGARNNANHPIIQGRKKEGRIHRYAATHEHEREYSHEHCYETQAVCETYDRRWYPLEIAGLVLDRCQSTRCFLMTKFQIEINFASIRNMIFHLSLCVLEKNEAKLFLNDIFPSFVQDSACPNATQTYPILQDTLF